MEKTISKKFKKNSKAVTVGKTSKEEVLAMLKESQVDKPIVNKTYVIINGVPCNPETKKPFTKVEK